MTTAIVLREHEGVKIPQRQSDRYINATAMCKACGKLWANYWQNKSTQDFVAELGSVIGIPITGLVQVRQGGTPDGQGTWVHPQVALHLAQWLSPAFAVKVTSWVLELLTTGSVTLEQVPVAQPVACRAWSERLTESFEAHFRYINHHKPGYWSVLVATNTHLMCIEDSLILHGLPTESNDLPDGSVGAHWRKLRQKRGLPEVHRYAPLRLPERNRTVQVKIFPPEERGIFDHFLTCVYMPTHLPDYLLQKFCKRFGRLPPLSAADHSCRRITDRSASILPLDRQAIRAAGGIVRATELLN